MTMAANMRLTRLIFLVVALSSCILLAQGEAGVESPFIMGATAKDLGMGRAACAFPDNSSAYLWNPAGMVVVQQKTLGVSYMTLFEGTQYQFVSYIHPTLSAGTFGLGVSRIGTGGIQQYEDVGGVPVHLGEMEYWWGKASIAYAARLWQGFAVGLNFDANRQELGAYNTNGFGLDAGVHFRVPAEVGLLRDLHFGFNYKHVLQPQMKLGTETEKLPPGMRFGAAKIFRLSRKSTWAILYDYEKLSYRSASQHIGTELGWNGMAFLRAGMDNGALAFGGGLRFAGMQIDYGNGLLGESDVFPRVHRFSISFHFGSTLREKVLQLVESRQIEVQQRVRDQEEENRRKRIKDNLALGRQYLDQGAYFDARLLLSRVLEDDPNHVEAKRLLESSKQAEDEQIKAREEALLAEGREKEQQDQDNEYVSVRYNEGLKELERGNLAKAIVLWEEALEKSPGNVQLEEYLQRARIEQEREINRLISEANRSIEAENLVQARRALESAKEKAGENSRLRGKVIAELRRLDNTVDYFKNYRAGMQAIEKQEWQKAADAFEQALKYRVNDQNLNELYRMASARARGVRKSMPAAAKKLYQQGITLYSQNKYQEALVKMNQALEIDPNNITIIDAIELIQQKMKENQ